jgi:hypothetical protein
MRVEQGFYDQCLLYHTYSIQVGVRGSTFQRSDRLLYNMNASSQPVGNCAGNTAEYIPRVCLNKCIHPLCSINYLFLGPAMLENNWTMRTAG